MAKNNGEKKSALRNVIDFFKNFDATPANVLKVAGVVVLGIVLIAVTVSIAGSSFRSLVGTKRTGYGPPPPSYGPTYDYGYGYGSDEFDEEEYGDISGYESIGYGGGVGAPPPDAFFEPPVPPILGGIIGDDAENFEVKDYTAAIATRSLKSTCASIADLKSLSYVIFENTTEHDRGCHYTFKVERDHTDEIVSVVKALGPEDFSENTFTIKKQIEDYMNEAEILRKKIASIDETLENAIEAYNEISGIAAKSQNAESLARIINSKLQLIDRLTRERFNANTQLDILARAEEEHLDRIDYTYFYVRIYEDKYIDFKSIGDSWKEAIKDFVDDINQILQDVTVNLLALLLFILQYVLYFFLLLIGAKYGWRLAKYIWKR